MIGLTIREIWTKKRFRKKTQLSELLVKKIFFQLSIENDGKLLKNDEYHIFMGFESLNRS